MMDLEASESPLVVTPDPSITRGRTASEIHPLARSVDEWKEVLAEWNEKPFRAKQIYQWVQQKRVYDPSLMTNISKGLRERLEKEGAFEPGRVDVVHRSSDGTRKLLLELDRKAKVECVLIPMSKGSKDADAAASADEDEEVEQKDAPRKRVTLCISTQFGCAMGCRFCASGQAGLFRGLGAAEVVYQVGRSRSYLDPDEDLRNLVFMGMGEPLHHYEETARALRILTDPDGGGMSPRRITVSTVGLVPGIRRLGEDFGGKIGLAVSLHAPDDETRNRIMPMNKRYPIAELMAALKDYPVPSRKRLTIEYILIGGVNDSLAHADRLAKLLEPIKVKVNLIPMNAIEASEWNSPDPQDVDAFCERLAGHGLSSFVRTRKGDDVDAACGQLAMKAIAPERLVRR